MNSIAAPTRPDHPLDLRGLLAELADLTPVIAEHGDEADRAGEVPAAVLDALATTRITSAMAPRVLGGSELRPSELLTVTRTLAHADPSTGWVIQAYIFLNGLAGAFLEPGAARALFETPRLAIAGQGTRPGRAVRRGDGYVLDGHFFFGSGVKHATHIHTAAITSDTAEPRFFLVPRDQVTFIDNWDVLGLRATGSIDYRLDSVFVPDELSYATLSTTPVTGGALYRVGIGNFASINHGAWALGVGRRILDELAALVRAKAGAPGSIAGNAAFHEGFAEAEVRLRSAHALLDDVWGEIEHELYDEGRDAVSIGAQSVNRAALVNATRALEDVARFAYRSAGSAALRAGTLQRLYRDVHGGMQHVSSSAGVMQSAGRYLAGLAEGQRWVHFELK